MPPNRQALENEIAAASQRLSGWLVDSAFGKWHANGHDSERGTFFETIDITTGEATDTPIRTRVPARQIYCFSQAGKLGGAARAGDGSAEDRVRTEAEAERPSLA